MAKVLGRKLGIFVMRGGVYENIGLSTSCSLDITGDMVEMASLGSLAKSFKRGRYGYTLQSERLYDSMAGGTMLRTIADAMLGGDTLRFRFAEMELVDGVNVIDSSATMTMSGDVIVTGYRINAPVDGYASVSISFQGTGELVCE